MTGLVFVCVLLTLFSHSDAVRCFDCRHVPFPSVCAKVTECNSDEYCSTEQIVTTSGNVVYNTMCLPKSRCSSVSLMGKRSGNTDKRATDLSTCLECCSENFCNIKGCGVPEISLEQRGQYCYNCDAVTDPKACQDVAVCLQDEICMLYSPPEFRGLPEAIYRSKCEKQSTCKDISAISSTNTCAVTCCGTDFCNDQCDTSQGTNNTTDATQTTVSHSKVTTEETTLPSSSNSPSTSKAPIQCGRVDGYVLMQNDSVQLCVHVVLQHTNWDEAQKACQHEGGNLVVLDTHDKALLLRHTLAASKHMYDHTSYWIGARDSLHHNHFSWTNGVPLKDSNTEWAKNEPDHGKTECVSMQREASHSSDKFKWHDSRCTDTKNYICERL